MFCSKCGKQNADDSKFCSSCGAALVQIIPASTSASAQHSGEQVVGQAGGQAITASSETTTTQITHAAVLGAQTVQSEFATQSGAQQNFRQNSQQQIYTESCTAAAWKDIKGTDGWFTKALLMALVGMVPILNWVNDGFLLKWSSQLSFGRREPMPKSLFEDNTFVIGAYNFVITLAVGVVLWIASFFLNAIPVLGIILVLAATLFLSVFAQLMAMRATLANRLGAGFELGEIWRVMQRGVGPIVFAIIVPELIAMVVIFVVFLIFIFMAFAVIGIGMGGYYLSDPTYAISIALAYGGMTVIILAIIAGLICFAAYVVVNMVVRRAVGHWVARFVPEWANIAAPTSTPTSTPSSFTRL